MNTTQEKIAMLTGACEKLEGDLAAAEAYAGSLRSEYDRDALSRIASGNAQAASKARKVIADAQAEADDRRAALTHTCEHLRLAQAELAAEVEAAAWDTAKIAMEEYVTGAVELQASVDAMIEKFLAVRPLAARMLQLTPNRGRVEFAEHQLVHDVRMYIAAKGGDRLGKLAQRTILDPTYLRSLPDLVGKAKGTTKELLSRRSVVKATTGDAA
jgi:hypothetical protein